MSGTIADAIRVALLDCEALALDSEQDRSALVTVLEAALAPYQALVDAATGAAIDTAPRTSPEDGWTFTWTGEHADRARAALRLLARR